MPHDDAAWNDGDDDFVEDEALVDDEDETEVVPCPSCGAEVYEDADQCPTCGEWITPTAAGRGGRWIAAVVVLMVVLLIVLTVL